MLLSNLAETLKGAYSSLCLEDLYARACKEALAQNEVYHASQSRRISSKS